MVDTLLLSDGQDAAVVRGWRAQVKSFDVLRSASWFGSRILNEKQYTASARLSRSCSFFCTAPHHLYLLASLEVRGCTSGIMGTGTEPRFWFKHNATSTGGPEGALENADSCQRDRQQDLIPTVTEETRP